MAIKETKTYCHKHMGGGVHRSIPHRTTHNVHQKPTQRLTTHWTQANNSTHRQCRGAKDCQYGTPHTEVETYRRQVPLPKGTNTTQTYHPGIHTLDEKCCRHPHKSTQTGTIQTKIRPTTALTVCAARRLSDDQSISAAQPAKTYAIGWSPNYTITHLQYPAHNSI